VPFGVRIKLAFVVVVLIVVAAPDAPVNASPESLLKINPVAAVDNEAVPEVVPASVSVPVPVDAAPIVIVAVPFVVNPAAVFEACEPAPKTIAFDVNDAADVTAVGAVSAPVVASNTIGADAVTANVPVPVGRVSVGVLWVA